MPSCRKDDGGFPACKLGNNAKQVQMRGKSLSSIIISRELRKTHTENDEYNRDYQLFIVLETPSKWDDIRGGVGFDDNFKKLIKFVKRAGFNPEYVFVTHLNKCVPPKRKPTVQEVKACLNYLYDELEATDPKVIMLLGAGALRLFNLHNKGGINVLRGTHITKHLPLDLKKKDWDIIPSYDLGYFKYVGDPKIEARAQEDYRKAYKLATTGSVTIKEYLAGFTLIDTPNKVKELVDRLKEKKFFAFDTESRGLPWSREPLICFSFCWNYEPEGRNCAILPIYQHDPNGLDWKLKKFWKPEEWDEVKILLKGVFEDKTISKAAHNAKYDINTIRKHTGIRVAGFIFDTMLMHHALNEKKPHGLEYLADLEFGVGDYSSEIHNITGRGRVLKATYDNIPDNTLWKYAANDAECCWRLAKLYYKELKAKPHLWKLYCDEIEPLTHTLADAEWMGHGISQKVLKDLLEDYAEERDVLLNKMQHTTFEGFNPMSPNHVRNALIQTGHREKILDPKKVQGYNTSKEVLLKLQEDGVELAEQILKYRNVTKILGTYLENVLEDIDNDGRVRYFWLIHGTESARLSCRFYHQIPRPDKRRKKAGKYNLRDMLIADPDNLLVYFDYSQVELRVLAILANDPEMIGVFERGEDLHAITTALLLGVPEDEFIKAYKEGDGIAAFNRQLGKNTNFGLAYGSEGYRLVQTNTWQDSNGVERPFTWGMLDRGKERFRERFTAVSNYLESVPQKARTNGGIYATPFGRERRMGSRLNDRDEYLRKAAEREIVNFSIQSTAAAITVRTLNMMHSWINQWRSEGLAENEIFLVNTVHDSGVWEVREDRVETFRNHLRLAAERKIPELQNKSFPCDIGVGKSWSEAEENSKAA